MLKNLKKYIPKRKYRERSQLEKRKKLGLLEKKDDYKQRAEDFHQKEKRYKKLKEEARLKNPEEFYFKMMNSKNLKGEHVKLRDEIPLEERIANHNKLLNLVNYKKSLQERVFHILIHNIFRKKKNYYSIFNYLITGTIMNQLTQFSLKMSMIV